MAHDYKKMLEETALKKMAAEARLTGAAQYYQAALFEQDEQAQERIRAEIHAIQDIILDCSAMLVVLGLKNLGK